MEKVLAIILAVIMTMSIGTAAIAADEEVPGAFDNASFSAEVEDVGQQEETEPEELQEPEEVDGPEIFDPMKPVAVMYLCATARSLTGHVWLYFENISNEDICVGYITLAPGEQTSVGSLRNSRTDGGGTYYNGEAFMAKNIDVTGRHTTYLSMELNASQLSVVSEQIKKRNTYNIFFWNCGNFAAAVWNSVTPYTIVHICLPVFTILQMKLHGAQKGFTMNRPSIDKCFKQVGDGVVPASADSFKSSCV